MEEKGRAGTRQDEITELSLFLFSSRLSCHVVEAAWCRDSGLVFHDGRRMYMHGMDKEREGLERARGREGVLVFAVSRMLQMWVGRVLFDLVGLMNRFAGLAATGAFFLSFKVAVVIIVVVGANCVVVLGIASLRFSRGSLRYE